MSEMECQDWRTMVYVMALDVEQAAVLLQADGHETYSLPHFEVEGGMWETTTAKMQEKIGPELSIKGQALYRPVYQEDKAVCRAEAVILVETEGAQALEGTWVSRQGLNDIRLTQPDFCALLAEVLGEVETGQVPALRPPWAKPGWHLGMAEWMTAELEKAGWQPTGQAVMGRNWALSYVGRMQAANGKGDDPAWFYFKTSLDLPLFVNEAEVTKGLAALYPGHAPQPVAIDADKKWMLLEEFGDLVGHDCSLEDKVDIVRQYGKLQVKSAEQVEALLAMGCCDRRLEWMLGEIGPLLTHSEVEKAITAEEAEKLRAMVERLKKMGRRLYEYGVPDALIHGDLHGSNVARNLGESDILLFFDWTDAAVGHPFFDMLIIYTEKDTAEREQMRDAYLACWTGFEPNDRLLECWRLAEVLAAVYHSISYLYIFLGVEEWGKTELYWAMPYWLGKILGYGDVINEFK